MYLLQSCHISISQIHQGPVDHRLASPHEFGSGLKKTLSNTYTIIKNHNTVNTYELTYLIQIR